VTSSFLASCLTRAADFHRLSFYEGQNIHVQVNPPRDAIKDLLSRPIEEWRLPPLVSVGETPILRPDGSAVDEPGYDATTRMIYVPSPSLKIPPIPEKPSPKELCAAVAQLDEAIGDFPFSDDASRANAFGMLLLPILRSVIRGCASITLVDAPQAGNGKSLLVEVPRLYTPAAMLR
jgi:hypothetical protein